MCVFCYLMYFGNLLHLIWDGLLLGFPFLFGVVAFRLMTLEFVSCGACHIDDGTEEHHPLCLLHPRTPSPHIIALLFDHSHVTHCSVDLTTQTTVNQTTNNEHSKVLETLFRSKLFSNAPETFHSVLTFSRLFKRFVLIYSPFSHFSSASQVHCSPLSHIFIPYYHNAF